MAVYMVSQAEVKKLRPRMTAGLIFVAGIAVVLLGQLVLNMVLTQDAYHLRSLKLEKRDLNTQVQILQEEVDSLASPQNLADAANRLGMVANPASVLLDIENDKVFGKPKPASAANASWLPMRLWEPFLTFPRQRSQALKCLRVSKPRNQLPLA